MLFFRSDKFVPLLLGFPFLQTSVAICIAFAMIWLCSWEALGQYWCCVEWNDPSRVNWDFSTCEEAFCTCSLALYYIERCYGHCLSKCFLSTHNSVASNKNSSSLMLQSELGWMMCCMHWTWTHERWPFCSTCLVPGLGWQKQLGAVQVFLFIWSHLLSLSFLKTPWS